MSKKETAPAPPDYGPLIAANKEAADKAFQLGQEQLDWAKTQYAQDKTITDKTVTSFLDMMDFSKANAEKDRARYEGTYQPLEDKLVADANSYASVDRRNQEMGRAEAGVGQQFDAARGAAERELESFGIDPSATRYAALDIGTRTQEAAAKAAAADAASRGVDDTARQLRAQAIDVGRGYPGQVAGSSAAGVGAGGAAGSGTLAQTASGASTMGTSPQYMGIGTGALAGWGNTLNSQYQNQLAQFNANQNSSSGIGGILGTVAGVGLRMAGFKKGGAVPIELSPSRGAVADDVHAGLTVGEFIVPRDVVSWMGEKNVQKMVQKARDERKQGVPTQTAMNMTGHRESTHIDDRRAQRGAVDPTQERTNTMFAPMPYDENGNPLPNYQQNNTPMAPLPPRAVPLG